MAAGRGFDELYEMLSANRQPLRFAAGEVIFEKGDPGDRMYIVREGSVALKNGDRVVETVSFPGLFGEMALIDDEPRSLSAVAVTDTQLVDVSSRHFWVFVHETPYFAQLVMGVMAKRLRVTGQDT